MNLNECGSSEVYFIWSSELQGFRKQRTAEPGYRTIASVQGPVLGQLRPGSAEAWCQCGRRIQHYNCQPEPALPNLAQSADIDPLHANKTLFCSLISWIVVSKKHKVLLLNHSPGGYLTISWVAPVYIDFTLLAMFHWWYLAEESIIFENHKNYDFLWILFSVRSLLVLCWKSVNIFCRV